MDRFDIDCLVIGAGVIGLACGAAVARRGGEALVVEAGRAFGAGVSSRNSEVIHAGIYYPPGSAKARYCVEGRRRLYDYCATRHVAHRKTGKMIVADQEGAARLEALAGTAAANGVDVSWISGDAARRLEPALAPGVAAAIESQETGIIDAHGLMTALVGELEDGGGAMALNAPVVGGGPRGPRMEAEIGGGGPARVGARMIVNAAGLFAVDVARLMGGEAETREPLPRPYFAKGAYFKYAGGHPFTRLIYPTPVDGGLGVHLTLDLAGAARFGPDVEWLDGDDPGAFDYGVDPARGDAFASAIRAYWSGVEPARLVPDYAGIRPKLVPRGAPPGDFVIDFRPLCRDGGLINLMGFESPGLTAALAVGEAVADLCTR